MKVAIIGAGKNRSGIGQYIAREFHKSGAAVAAVLGTSAATAQRAAAALQQYGICATAYTDIESLLAQEQPDAAVIASPAATHQDYLHRLLAAGVHVLCEKPFIWPAPDDLPLLLESIFTQAGHKQLLIAMNSQWPFALPWYEELCGPLAGQAISTCYVRLSPLAMGSQMIPEGLPHALSILYAVCGQGELSSLTVNGSQEQMDIAFDYKFRGGTCRTAVRLTHQVEQPRSFELGFNENIVTRVVDPSCYDIYFTCQGRKIKIDDPLALSVKNFIRAVRGQGELLIGRHHIADTMILLKTIGDFCTRISWGRMKKLTHKEHDFSTKLRQASVIERLKQYVAWQRSAAQGSPLPGFSPISINLDLTAACNFACPHCVDSEIINTGKSLDLEEVLVTIEYLQTRGLLSVILLGGGEPTLHRQFEEIVSRIKARGLQLGVVTNGTQLSRVARIAPVLEQHDWVRLSLDAASQETFARSHRPKVSASLAEILDNAQDIKRLNPRVSLGYSFVIVWEGLALNGAELCPNVDEMAAAARLARSHGFDYISFKPCLVRLQSSHKESLLDSVDRAQEHKIVAAIRRNLRAARQAAGTRLRILESVNLQAMMSDKIDELKHQPRTCHMQYFKTVVAPAGIFHCPAFRGVARARIADSNGYAGQEQFSRTMHTLTDSIARFNASKECGVVGCFYHHVNWWLDNLIRSHESIDSIEAVADDNFFF